MSAIASEGCNGRSGDSTSARPLKASRSALAGTHCPLAKKPCKNSILLLSIDIAICH